MPNRAGLIGDRPRDGLTDPPGGVRAELKAAAVFVFIDRTHQAGVAFLDQIQKAEAAIAILFGNADHEPQVSAGELTFDLLIVGELLRDQFEPSFASCADFPG